MNTATHPLVLVRHPFARMSHLMGLLSHRTTRFAAEQPATGFHLQHAQSHVVGAFHDGTIECLSGCIWITHDGDCRDIVLQQGQSHVVDRTSCLLVYGLLASDVRLIP